jgi:hypothetical protein
MNGILATAAAQSPTPTPPTSTPTVGTYTVALTTTAGNELTHTITDTFVVARIAAADGHLQL